MHVVHTTPVAASADAVFAFHERPDAFALLQPPWQKAEIIQAPTSLAIGTRVELRVRVLGMWQRIVAEHVAYEPGRMFADTLVEGPFATWLHRHVVTPVTATTCTLTDDITCTLPLGGLGRLGDPIVKRQLARLFAYRHEVTRRECERG